MATPTTNEKFVEQQLSNAKADVNRALDAIKAIDVVGRNTKLLNTKYINKLTEIRFCQNHLLDVLKYLNRIV